METANVIDSSTPIVPAEKAVFLDPVPRHEMTSSLFPCKAVVVCTLLLVI
jgi:hypothetical protein